jgi:hypothetical protein
MRESMRMTWLVASRLQMKTVDLKAPNVWGKTPLEWARSCNRPDVAGFIERRYTQLGIPLDPPQGAAQAKVRGGQ